MYGSLCHGMIFPSATIVKVISAPLAGLDMVGS